MANDMKIPRSVYDKIHGKCHDSVTLSYERRKQNLDKEILIFVKFLKKVILNFKALFVFMKKGEGQHF